MTADLKFSRLQRRWHLLPFLLLAVCSVAHAATDMIANTYPPIIQGDPRSSSGNGLAIDSAGNRYLCGSYFASDLDFNPGPGLDANNSSGADQDAFVTRFNADGSYAWTQILTGTGSESALAVTVTADGSTVFVAGTFTSPSIQIGATGPAVSASGPAGSAFVISLNAATGAARTTFGLAASGIQKLGGSTGGDTISGLLINGGTLYAAGSIFGNTCRIGSTAPPTNSAGARDACVIAIDTSVGAPVATFGLAGSGIQRFGGTADFEEAYSLAIAGSTLFVCGKYASAAAQLGGTGPTFTATNSDAFVLALSTSTGLGIGAWGVASSGVQTISGSAEDEATSMSVLGTTLYISGMFDSTDLMVGSGAPTVTSAGLGDVFVAAISAITGTRVNAFGLALSGLQTFGGQVNEVPRTISAIGSRVYVAADVFSTDAKIGATGPAVGATGGNTDVMVFVLSPSTGVAQTTFGISASGIQKIGGGLFENQGGMVIVGQTLFISGSSDSTDLGVGGLGPFSSNNFGGFLITLNSSNGALNVQPSNIALSANTISETSPASTTIGNFSTTDPDGGIFNYALVAGLGSADNGSFRISGVSLVSTVIFNFATKSSYTIRVRSTDAGGLFTEKIFTVLVQPAPAGIRDTTLSPNSVAEGLPIGTNIGLFTTSDPNPNLSYTYALIDGVGGEGNASFSITGNTLKTAAVIDFNLTNSLNILVRTTDQNGVIFDKGFGITVTTVPNSGGAGIKNGSDGGAIENPVDGLLIKVVSSDGGLIQLSIDPSGLKSRAIMDVDTEFGDIPGRSVKIRGFNPAHKFTRRGIFIARSTATDRATGKMVGVGRKTLTISAKETGEVIGVTADERGILRMLGDPPNNALTTKSFKGKFIFSAAKSDSVTFNGSFLLPANLDTSKPHEVSFAMGNNVVDATIDEKGRGTAISNVDVLKSLKVRYSKVKRGALTKGGETAFVTATFSTTALVEKGFDTEGVTVRSTDVAPGKSGPRSIQTALLLDGVAYELLAPVTFAISNNSEFGTIQSRK